MRPKALSTSTYPFMFAFCSIGDGSTQSLDVDGKWSSTIMTELMDIGGGPRWEQWKQERTAAGLPVIDIPKPKPKLQPKQASSPSPSSSRAAPNPFAMADDEPLVFNSGKTGAAAVLP